MKKAGTKQKKKAKRTTRSLVIERLENVSKDVFRKHYDLIAKLVGDSPGIYALYDGTELYYVGKSSDLRKRVKRHLHDRHYASWTHFSLYLVRKTEHISEIESLLIRIANPEGNRRVPKGRSSASMLRQLKAMVKKKQEEEFRQMFGEKKRRRKMAKEPEHEGRKSLKGLVQRRRTLYRTYKGKDFRATLTPGGVIKLGKKRFNSPTAAACAVTGRTRGINGWTFWYIKSKEGQWVRLRDYQV